MGHHRWAFGGVDGGLELRQCRADGRPGWIYLLGAGYAFWASRDLTPAEHEVSAYVSLVNGVSGVYYFASHPKSASAWERITRPSTNSIT